MALVLELVDNASLRCRFAISPLAEVADALISLTRPEMEPFHLPWQRRARRVLASTDLSLLLALYATDWSPDFLTPPPAGPFADFGSGLVAVRATPDEVVEAELAEWRRSRGARRHLREHPELAGAAGVVRERVADQLELAWTLLVEPWWPQLRDVLDADISYRARQMADEGIAAVLNDLHTLISFVDGTVRFTPKRAAGGGRSVRDSGLVLIPSVFAWPKCGVSFDRPGDPAIIYPARGVGRLWEATPPGRNLSRLIGETRARVLIALAEPASTTGLAARCRLPASSVSEHVRVLRECGLVGTVRTGRFLLHQQTILGTALAADPG